MKSVFLFAIVMQIVTCLTTDNSLTVTFDQTTETAFSNNVSTSTLPPMITTRYYYSTSQPPSVPKPSRNREAFKTDAPMLNYIFDSHSSKAKHHHHDTYKWGPHFEPSDVHLNGTTVTVQVNGTAVLNCRVNYLQDKMISWFRKENDQLKLLTVGRHTYAGDDRYTLEFQYPGNWRLQIRNVSKKDEGIYECQISTHPPKVIQMFLYINAPEVVIVDEHGVRLMDKYYESDSTIQLSCIVRHTAPSMVLWMHGNKTLNYDITRGGISVKTDLMEDGANSTLSVARVDKSDSGNYTCTISKTEYATVAVHILNEESLAELHHGDKCSIHTSSRILKLIIFALLVASMR